MEKLFIFIHPITRCHYTKYSITKSIYIEKNGVYSFSKLTRRKVDKN